jgi:methyltransferase (TIGR00027 family)
MGKAAAKTASGPVAMVAIEQFFPSHQRIVSDDLACWMLSPGARIITRLMQPRFARNRVVRAAESTYPGLWSGMMCRKRYIDETVIASSGAMEAIVNLGAGFDTRAYRLAALSRIRVWECDQPANIKLKRQRLQCRFGNLPDSISLVPIDFDREALGPSLAARGYLATGRTFFIWEGVSQYLSEAGVRTTLDFLAKAAPASRLVFTYIRRDFLSGENLHGQERLYDRYVKPAIWLFGLHPRRLSDFLNPYGWRLHDDLGSEELSERYVKPTGRSLMSSPIERIAVAEKYGT